MAGWLWFFGMPTDLYGPLARIAKTYTDADQFAGSAARLLSQVSDEDCDVFLGYFIDIASDSIRYNVDEFKEVPFAEGQLWLGETEDFPLPARRRQKRRSIHDELRIALVHTLGTEQLRQSMGEVLEQKASQAAPNEWAGEYYLRVTSKASHPRWKEKPPENLA